VADHDAMPGMPLLQEEFCETLSAAAHVGKREVSGYLAAPTIGAEVDRVAAPPASSTRSQDAFIWLLRPKIIP
jgi:hypothetical protein